MSRFLEPYAPIPPADSAKPVSFLTCSEEKEGAERYRFLADAMPQIVWTAQHDGGLDYCNRAGLDYLGLPLEALRGWEWASVVHPEDRETCTDIWKRALQSLEAYEIEYRLRRGADGAYRWHLCRGVAHPGAQPDQTQWVGTCMDVHDQRETEERLRRAHREMEACVRERTVDLAQANQFLCEEIEEHKATEATLRAVIAAQGEIARAERNSESLMRVILERTQQATRAEGVVLERLESEELVYSAAVGTALPFLHTRVRLDASLSGQAVRENRILRCDDTADDPRVNYNLCQHIGIGSMIVVPLRYQQTSFGALKVLASHPHAFDDHDVTALQLMAGVIASALNDVRTYETNQALLAERTEALEAARRSEERQRESERFSERVADSSPDILYIYDLIEHRNVYANRGIAEVMGYTPQEIQAMGETMLLQVIHPDDAAAFQAHHDRVRQAKDGAIIELEYRVRYATGGWRWLNSRDTPFLRTENGQVRQLMGVGQDITQRKLAEEQVEEQMLRINEVCSQLEYQKVELESANTRLKMLAVTDGLTGLKNHRAFRERLEQEFQRAQRYNAPLSVILLDVDKFKQYNDTYGHPAGDEILKQVAQTLSDLARATDMVARYGGEEFVLILSDTGVEEALAAAERLRAALDQSEWPRRPITASFGVATFDRLTPSAAELVTQADNALYASKHNGRNCVSHADNLKDAQAELIPEESDENHLAADAARRVAAELTRAYDATIEGWSRILDLRDKETEGHTERVTAMCLHLARRMGLSEEEQVYIRWGALLHDMGKMGIPDSILHKPASLTDAEWDVMRRHPGYAFEMLSPIGFLKPALDIPYCHHEKWDGTGYPRGLRARQIPLAARLFAVVDVWDALRSDRPYRAGWPEARVRAYLREQAGTHFDPLVAEAFFAILHEYDMAIQAEPARAA